MLKALGQEADPQVTVKRPFPSRPSIAAIPGILWLVAGARIPGRNAAVALDDLKAGHSPEPVDLGNTHIAELGKVFREQPLDLSATSDTLPPASTAASVKPTTTLLGSWLYG